MTSKTLPTPEYLRKRLRYEPETGKLFWIDCDEETNSWRAKYVNKEAFTSFMNQGYRQGTIKKSGFLAHRVIWAIYYGKWPEKTIDHIDGDRSNNKITNLREATQSENSRNMSISKRNKSGFIGVSWSKQRNKWHVQMMVNGINKSFGFYDDISEAAKRRLQVSKGHGYSDGHGKVINK